jgi:hypothetical protein
MDEQVYMKEVSKMGRPIPGQSLTTNPENPAPYERPPEYTNVHEATMYLWDTVTEDETYVALMEGVSKGVPVMNIVEVMLFGGFNSGKWNPDLMMMLAEPLAYMIIALAERLDLDIRIDGEDDGEDERSLFGVEVEEELLEKLKNSQLPQGFITEDMAQEMKSLPTVSSLLNPSSPEEPQMQEAPEEPEMQKAPEQPSLMAQPEGQ